jgi:hypothetical protein
MKGNGRVRLSLKLYNTDAPKPSDWQFVYFDDADTAGALGYHEQTYNGQPISKVFVKTTLKVNELVSVTACHELFEMVIVPLANLWAESPDGTEYAYEMRTLSWSTESRCRISCTRRGLNRSNTRQERSSIISGCSRRPLV